jgi:hypothetical protein
MAMATQLSKADRIRKLLHLSNAEVAKRVGCSPDYVRATRQRTSKDGNPVNPATNANWRMANKPRIRARVRERYASDPEFRRKQDASTANWRKANRDRYNAWQRAYTAKRRAEVRAS